MKALLISDHAKWCSLMMNGDKKVEVRKGTALYKAIQKLIDEYGYADIYVYCTKEKPYLGKKEIGRNFYNEPIYTYDLDYGETFKGSGNKKFYSSVGVYSINGKVIFKFRCYKVSDFSKGELIYYKNDGWCGSEVEHINTNGMCLSEEELHNYLKGKTGCAIHISDLEIFDKPKELSEFKKPSYVEVTTLADKEPKYICVGSPLTKSPQSFCYIEVGE